MPRKIFPKEILYVRVSKANREYCRQMKEYFSTESRYIDKLILRDRLKNTSKKLRVKLLAKIAQGKIEKNITTHDVE